MDDNNHKEYLKNPFLCPSCKGEELAGEDIEVTGTVLYQEISCGDCGCIWNDIYHLVDIEILNEGRKQ